MAGATGLEPATSGVTSRQFCNDFNVTTPIRRAETGPGAVGQPEHRLGLKAAEMAQARMRTARPRLVKILLSCSRHVTQAAREQGSDLVDCWFYITIERGRNAPDGYFDHTGSGDPATRLASRHLKSDIYFDHTGCSRSPGTRPWTDAASLKTVVISCTIATRSIPAPSERSLNQLASKLCPCRHGVQI
jgi:hypothetical protein